MQFGGPLLVKGGPRGPVGFIVWQSHEPAAQHAPFLEGLVVSFHVGGNFLDLIAIRETAEVQAPILRPTDPLPEPLVVQFPRTHVGAFRREVILGILEIMSQERRRDRGG